MSPDEPDDRTPGEERLLGHLSLLRSDVPRASRSLTARVVSAARWQRVVRAPARAAGRLALAFADGLRLLIGSRRSS